MRRTVLAVIAGGALLLSTAGCGVAMADPVAGPPSAAAPSSAPAPAPSADYTADTKKICAEVEKMLEGKEMEKFGIALGKLLVYKQGKVADRAKKARTDAGTKLTALATALRDRTKAAQDPDLRAAGAESADNMVDSAADDAFFGKIKTEKDLDTVLQSELTAWFTPVVAACP